MGTAMAKKRPAEKEVAGADYQSVRLLIEDARRLSQLSALRGENSSATTFRVLFGKLLDTSLIEASERRAAELRREQKGQ